jgi:hypothetical protein
MVGVYGVQVVRLRHFIYCTFKEFKPITVFCRKLSSIAFVAIRWTEAIKQMVIINVIDPV